MAPSWAEVVGRGGVLPPAGRTNSSPPPAGHCPSPTLVHLLKLYRGCKMEGRWARLTLETFEGEEELSFCCRSSSTSAAATVSPSNVTGTRRRGRKRPPNEKRRRRREGDASSSWRRIEKEHQLELLLTEQPNLQQPHLQQRHVQQLRWQQPHSQLPEQPNLQQPNLQQQHAQQLS
jgi:hypothetical protein